MEEQTRKASQATYKRPRAWKNVYQWHLGQVPDDEPSKGSAIFVVHGMGRQRWAETSATLRVKMEDALETMLLKNNKWENLPAPFIQEGFWADYDDFKNSFADEYDRLEHSKRPFFEKLWSARSTSKLKTFTWFILQSSRLVFDFRILCKATLAYFIYFLLFFVGPPLFLIIYFLLPSVMSQVLNDVRIYCSPRGMVERAIVQRIDKRVGEAFLKLVGIDWEFYTLPEIEKYKVDGKPIEFKRVFWVAHSLGSVVSYNVLSDIFAKADYLSKYGDKIQKQNVNKFWDSLQRFITIGSPLDKIAVLFGKKVLRPWPHRMFPKNKKQREAANIGLRNFLPNWWVNYYHFFDPVSGALSNKLICPVNQLPNNYHLRNIFRLPGLAHVAYWKDKTFLSYLLSRFFGIDRIVYKEKMFPGILLFLFGTTAYLIWMGIVAGILYSLWQLILIII